MGKKKKKNRNKKRLNKVNCSKKKKLSLKDIILVNDLFINFENIIKLTNDNDLNIDNFNNKVILSPKKDNEYNERSNKSINNLIDNIVQNKKKIINNSYLYQNNHYYEKKKNMEDQKKIYFQVFKEILEYINSQEITEHDINIDFKLNEWAAWIYT